MFVLLKNKLFHRKSKIFHQACDYAKYSKTLIFLYCRAKDKKRYELVRTCIKSALKNRKSLSPSEFKTIETELCSKSYEFKYRGYCRYVFKVLSELQPPNDSLENAKHFVEAYNLKNNQRFKLQMINFYAKKASETNLTDEEEQELLRRCNEIIAEKLQKFSVWNSVVAMGLCATKEWRKALELPRLGEKHLNVLAQISLRDDDIDLTWNLLQKLSTLSTLSTYDENLENETIESFAKYLHRNPAHIPEEAEKLFSFCEKLNVLFYESSVKTLIDALDRNGHHAEITKFDLSGMCNVCKNKLQEAERLTDDEFNILQTEFLNNVVKDNDIYQKTTPDEWESFERVIKENGPFDIVMDGLNIAYLANITENNQVDGSSRLQFSPFKHVPCPIALEKAIEQIKNEAKRILVIGRKHMDDWPNMSRIQQMATVFLVDNMSNDDIFALFAAIHSGPNAYIVSNDFMRQYKSAMGYKYNQLFKLWQQEHWYGFNVGQNKKIMLLKPMQYKMHIHKVGDYWHIPYRPNELESKMWNCYMLPEDWACIKINQNIDCVQNIIY